MLSPLLIFFSLVSCTGCKNKIDLPQRDTTPPTYKWVVQVQNKNSDQYEFATSGQQLLLNKDYHYSVFFVAFDKDGGVKKISLTGGGRTACQQSPEDNIESVSCNDNAVFYPDVNGKVEISAFRFCSFDLSCRYTPGDLFPQVITGPGGKVILTGYAENYHGGKTTSMLSIINVP